MMNCKETARLICEGCDRDLPWYVRVRLCLHLALCFVCRNFSKQIDTVSKIARSAGGAEAGSPIAEGRVYDQCLSSETKARLKKMMSKQQ